MTGRRPGIEFQPISANVSNDGEVTTTLHLEFRDQDVQDNSYLRVNGVNLGRIVDFKDDSRQLEAFIPFVTTGFSVEVPTGLLRESEENIKIDLFTSVTDEFFLMNLIIS